MFGQNWWHLLNKLRYWPLYLLNTSVCHICLINGTQIVPNLLLLAISILWLQLVTKTG
jgi:hypothetical protein